MINVKAKVVNRTVVSCPIGNIKETGSVLINIYSEGIQSRINKVPIYLQIYAKP